MSHDPVAPESTRPLSTAADGALSATELETISGGISSPRDLSSGQATGQAIKLSDVLVTSLATARPPR